MFSDAARHGAGRNMVTFHNAKCGARDTVDLGRYLAQRIYLLETQAGQGVAEICDNPQVRGEKQTKAGSGLVRQGAAADG